MTSLCKRTLSYQKKGERISEITYSKTDIVQDQKFRSINLSKVVKQFYLVLKIGGGWGKFLLKYSFKVKPLFISRRIQFGASQAKSSRPYLKNNLKQKGLDAWLS
jgi:hypothetical protein